MNFRDVYMDFRDAYMNFRDAYMNFRDAYMNFRDAYMDFRDAYMDFRDAYKRIKKTKEHPLVVSFDSRRTGIQSLRNVKKMRLENKKKSEQKHCMDRVRILTHGVIF